VRRLFLDTNVIIDFLADRKPFAEAAGQLFTLTIDKKALIYCSAISFNNIYYLLRQTYPHLPSIKLLEELSGMTEIIAVDEKIIRLSLKSNFNDLEDAIQYFSAISVNNLNGIVTRNSKDFRKSTLPVLSPNEALTLF
jgi:predicted nucleic acid-binding protein